MNFIFRQFQHLLLIAVLFLCLTACLKSTKETTIVGKVLTYGTEEIMDHPPVKVQLYREDPTSCWGCGTNYTVIDEMWTDSSMSFTLNAKLHTDETYFLGVDEYTVRESTGYIPPVFKDLDDYEIRFRGGTHHMDYHVVGLGWVRFHLYSENPQAGDVYWYSAGGSFEEFHGGVNAYRLINFGGNFHKEIAYGILRRGEYINFTKDFFVPAFDTIDVSINF